MDTSSKKDADVFRQTFCIEEVVLVVGGDSVTSGGNENVGEHAFSLFHGASKVPGERSPQRAFLNNLSSKNVENCYLG